MTSNQSCAAGAAFLAFALAAACAPARPHVSPPSLRVEAVGARPSADAFWVTGRWRWTGTAYAWVPGRWERDRPGLVWVPGRWTRSGKHWVWVSGRWRKALP